MIVIDTPSKFLAGNSKVLEIEEEEEEEEKFEEMSKQRDLNHVSTSHKIAHKMQCLVTSQSDDDDDMKFEEMTNNILDIDTEEPIISVSAAICEKNKNSVKLEFKDIDQEDEEEEEEIFKIKETEEQPEVEEEDVDLLHPVNSTPKFREKPESIDLSPPKCSPRTSVQTTDCILGALGNDIVKSIEKANVLYEGGSGDSGNLVFKNNDNVSSEDDLEFKPVTSGKNKKKRSKNTNNNFSSNQNTTTTNSNNIKVNNKNSASHSEASSFADSESSEAMESAMENKNSSEGWSFEADSSDIFKLLNVENLAGNSNSTDLLTSESTTTTVKKEEKAALEDVFKFDSELSCSGATGRRAPDENESGSTGTGSNSNNKPEMTSSLNYEEQEETTSEAENSKTCLKNSGTSGLSQSLTSWATTTSTSESEVGNSPNPRATSKKKGKKKKKR